LETKRHEAAQLRAQLWHILCYKIEQQERGNVPLTTELYNLINYAAEKGLINGKEKAEMHSAREEMNKVIHADPGDNDSELPNSEQEWRKFIEKKEKQGTKKKK